MKCALVNRQVMMRLHSHYRCGQSLRVLSSLLTPLTTTACTHNSLQQQQQQQQYHRTYVSHVKFTDQTKQNHKIYERATAFGYTFHRCCMSFYAPSTCAGEKIVVKVPTMGDSITEVRRTEHWTDTKNITALVSLVDSV
jgi:hypothetical protein